MTVIDCAGTGREMGRAHGEQARDAVRAALAHWRADGGGVAGLVHASPLLDTVQRLMPELADELQGIAEGAAVPFEDVVAYNCMDEQWWLGRQHRRRAGCSVLGGHTARGTLLAQNMDLPPAMDGTQIVLRLRPEDGPEQLVLSAAGLVGLTGVNAAGVAVCVNTLGMLHGGSRGLPVAAVIRGALTRRTRVEAIAFLSAVPHASGQHYAVADTGGLDSVECSVGGVVSALAPGARRIVHTNHPLASTDIDPVALEELRTEGRLSDSEARLAFLARALRPEVSSAALERLLEDTTVPVCMSGRPGWPMRTFGTVSYALGLAPRARFRLGLPESAQWTEPAWSNPSAG
ncbi:C45 family autoproteolytic acyltransferase/hydolase [Streptomyces sp. NPDC056821]|uniref:C45 family autoproteolytic acyltransferase/hydolase n=1 Tax=unclassified Streptomyces TaxID=2593676 RepID=UPI0036A32469